MKRAALLLALLIGLVAGTWLALPRRGDTPLPSVVPAERETATTPSAPPTAQASRAPVTAVTSPSTEAAPSKQAAIVGRVRDALGHPLAECTVTFSELDPEHGLLPVSSGDTTAQAASGTDGRFALSLGKHRPGVLTLVHRDFPLRIVAPRLHVEPGTTRDLGDVTLFSQPGLIVIVRTAALVVVPNAIVTATPTLRDVSLPTAVHGLGERTAATDAQGHAVLYGMAAGPYTVRVEAAHMAAHERAHLQPENPPRAAELVVVVSGGHVILGQVEAPVGTDPGRTVVVAEPADGGVVLTAQVTKDGDFRLSGATAGRYRINVESVRLGRAQAEVVVPGRRVVITLDGGRTMRGIVRARATGDPIPGAMVRAEPRDGWPLVRAGETVRPETETNLDGLFSIVGLLEGSFTLLVTSELFVPARFGPLAVDAQPIEILLDRGLSVAATLRHHGQPVAAANVQAMEWDAEGSAFALWKATLASSAGRQTTSRADGAFVLHGLRTRGQRLVIEAADCATWFSEPLTGAEGESLNLGTITLVAGAGVEGTAEPNATVFLDSQSSHRLTRTCHADTKGRFAFRNLPAGDYVLFYHSEDRPRPSATPARAASRYPLTLLPGARKTVSLTP